MPMIKLFPDWSGFPSEHVNAVVDLGARAVVSASQRIDRLFRNEAVQKSEFSAEQASSEGHDASQEDSRARCLVHYAVGDIHGSYELLQDILSLIEQDARAQEAQAVVVFLGDFVNRGLQSREVIERLLAGPDKADQQWIFLRGNHDQLLVEALLEKDEAAFRRLLRKGGAQTLASYGLAKKQMTLSRAAAAIPVEHLQFLAQLPTSHRIDGYLFVHAGVDPRLPMEAQSDKIFMTIREPFARFSHRLPFTVVHGHVSTRLAPVVAPGRVGIDTAAYRSGILTAAVIAPGRPLRFLSTGSASRK